MTLSKHFKMRKIILHCDGARAYKYEKIPGVVTDHAKHKRPHPLYSVKKLHFLPIDQKKTHVPRAQQGELQKRWVKTGTQLIDNVWRQLKEKGMPKTTIAKNDLIDKCVREFQWMHWHGEDDKWKAMGHVFEA